MSDEKKIAIKAALEAGEAIMEVYENEDFQVEVKEDESPLTIADKKANEVINGHLGRTGIPIISEENKQLSFEERKQWEQCWIVDPLDGTKEFIKKNGEFTVNIAHVNKGRPMFGIIYAPALHLLYFGDVVGKKAFRVKISSGMDVEAILRNAEEIKPAKNDKDIKIVGSRSHMNDDTLAYIEGLKKKYGGSIEIVPKGSSLKFCLIAEGSAHFYPRFGPTMEWDTAAGQAICEAVGLNCFLKDSGKSITYNRKNFLNGPFLVSNERQQP